MQVSDNKVITLTYELYLKENDEDLEIVEVAGEDSPKVFLFGKSGLPEDFENQILNLKENDDFDFTLNPQQGFGEFSEDDIAEFPKEMFKVENIDNDALDNVVPADLLEVGNFIPFTNDEGNQMTGRVHAIENEIVKIDFNHPLAGKSLKFEGKILKIREATAEEIAHGHVHGEGGVEH